MASDAQIAANRQNATLSTGPRSESGKHAVSRNAASHGLFATRDFVRPEELQQYSDLRIEYWRRLSPDGPLEQTLAAEIVRAAWRLHRCSDLEATLAERAIAALAEGKPMLDPMEDESTIHIQNSIDRARAQSHRILLKTVAELRRVQTERRQAAKPQAPESDFAKQTQSAPVESPAIPRNAPCPCGSGEKFKRCCGKNAPPVLHMAA